MRTSVFILMVMMGMSKCSGAFASERTYANGNVKWGETEIFEFHVASTALKACLAVSKAFELGQEDECKDVKDPISKETIHINMKKGHYVCVDNARYNPKTKKSDASFCFDLYEMTER